MMLLTEVITKMPTSHPTPAPQYTPLGSGTRSLLPPCRVCGGKASGLHYCVNTCQGCRMFFRRVIKKEAKPVCYLTGNCVIEAHTVRTSCPGCRYQKCLQMGMKVNDKRVGRYSHAMRTTYTQEVQALQLNVQVSSHSQSLLSTSERAQQLDHMITHLTDRYYSRVWNTAEFLADLPDKEARYKEEKRMKSKLFGGMRLLSDEEYESMYRHTGVDVDCRRDFMKKLFPGIDMLSYDFIRYAQAIPGFRRLPVNDQLSVLRACVIKADIMCGYHVYNEELNSWTFPSLETKCVDKMAELHDAAKVDLLTKACVGVQQLDLTPEESAVIYAFLIVSADAEVSKEGGRILCHLQNTITDLLLRVIKQHRDDEEDVNAFLSRLLPVLLTIESASSAMLKSYQYTIQKYPDLHWPFAARVAFDPERVECLSELWTEVLRL